MLDEPRIATGERMDPSSAAIIENTRTLQGMAATAERYTKGQIDASEAVAELAGYLTTDVVFWSNYTPTWPLLRPLFCERHGRDGIVERYAYENQHERIEGGSGGLEGFAVAADVAYYAQRETATFFEHRPVTWEMVTRVAFREGKIARIEMFLDARPIEAVYAAERMEG
jgi:hypothetical protein